MEQPEPTTPVSFESSCETPFARVFTSIGYIPGESMRPAFPIVADQSVLDAPFISENGSSIRELDYSNHLIQTLESPELDPVLLDAQP